MAEGLQCALDRRVTETGRNLRHAANEGRKSSSDRVRIGNVGASRDLDLAPDGHRLRRLTREGQNAFDDLDEELVLLLRRQDTSDRIGQANGLVARRPPERDNERVRDGVRKHIRLRPAERRHHVLFLVDSGAVDEGSIRGRRQPGLGRARDGGETNGHRYFLAMPSRRC